MQKEILAQLKREVIETINKSVLPEPEKSRRREFVESLVRESDNGKADIK